jgi:cyclic pyranopterin phosphate synthase
MTSTALEAVLGGGLAKGDALAVARVAGIMAAKRTAEIIPLCHPLPLDHVAVELTPDPRLPGLRVDTEVVTVARTGAEMEALTAAAASLLTLYDMAKALDRGMAIESVRLESKAGGASGTFVRGEDAPRRRRADRGPGDGRHAVRRGFPGRPADDRHPTSAGGDPRDRPAPGRR